MACEVCEHCHAVVSPTDKLIIREGWSYHDKCHKCYVCSETNLQDAEVFKGVIFCSSCAKRIFQGCSTVKKFKNSRDRRSRSHKRRSHRTQGRRRPNHDGILELTTLACSSSSHGSAHNDSSVKCYCCIQKLLDDAAQFFSKSLALSTDHTCQDKSIMQSNQREDFKASSVEMGMITDVTQELLREMKCPIPDYRKAIQLHKPSEKPKVQKYPVVHTRQRFEPTTFGIKAEKKSVSDLRIAELGTSTEIANMALRNKSEMPVIIKSETKPSFSTSGARRESDRTSRRNEDWLDSAYSSLNDSSRSNRTRWMDRKLGSILRIPYTAFKRNILERSSLISVKMFAENNRTTLLKSLKMLFNQEVTEHQRRGIKRLYSTINRQKIPHKLGWLHLVDKVKENEDKCSRSSHDHCHKRCKHYRRSHSYRCMRAQVMRLAGPTASELAYLRERMANLLIPRVLWGVFEKKYAIMMSQACGPSIQGSTK